MNKKKLILAVIVVIAIIAFIWCLKSFSDHSDTTSQPSISQPVVASPESNTTQVVDDGVELVAPELVKVPNQENKPIEVVELEVGINGNQSNINNNEMIENITQLIGSGFLKEAKSEAEFSLKNATETRIIKVEVLESSIKTR